MAWLRGFLPVMSVADLIDWSRGARKDGTLVFTRPSGLEIRVSFVEGRIISVLSSSARESVSAHLVFRGHCEPSDLEWAEGRADDTGILADQLLLLVSAGKVGEPVARELVRRKAVEDACELFLWNEGRFELERSVFQGHQFFVIDLDPIQIVSLGLSRRERWNRMLAVISSETVFSKGGGEAEEIDPALVSWEDQTLAELLASRVDGKSTIREITESLPFSRFEVRQAAADLLANGWISPVDRGDEKARIAELVARSEAARGAGHWDRSLEILEGLVAAHPQRQDLERLLQETRSAFRKEVYEHYFSPFQAPVLAIGAEALRTMALPEQDAQILALVDGQRSVRQILSEVDVEEDRGLRILERLCRARILDFLEVAPLLPPIEPYS